MTDRTVRAARGVAADDSIDIDDHPHFWCVHPLPNSSPSTSRHLCGCARQALSTPRPWPRPNRQPLIMPGDPMMGSDVDIMGVQRGAHKDGEDVCPQFVFKVPGGTQADGTPLWGWNDVSCAYCKRCKARDLDHIIIRDTASEDIERDREKFMPRKKVTPAAAPAVDATARSPEPLSRARRLEPTQPMQLFELEPGVPDPLAFNAYRDAERERRLAAERASATAPSRTGAAAAQEEENERFKEEVERMVREQLAKEKLGSLAPAAGSLSVAEMLESLGLSQYTAAFEEEGIEIAVLVALAESEDGKLVSASRSPHCMRARRSTCVRLCVSMCRRQWTMRSRRLACARSATVSRSLPRFRSRRLVSLRPRMPVAMCTHTSERERERRAATADGDAVAGARSAPAPADARRQSTDDETGERHGKPK